MKFIFSFFFFFFFFWVVGECWPVFAEGESCAHPLQEVEIECRFLFCLFVCLFVCFVYLSLLSLFPFLTFSSPSPSLHPPLTVGIFLVEKTVLLFGILRKNQWEMTKFMFLIHHLHCFHLSLVCFFLFVLFYFVLFQLFFFVSNLPSPPSALI